MKLVTRHSLLVTVILLVFATIIPAQQPAPDRRAEVRKAFESLTVQGEVPGDEPRRQNLYAVGRYLNAIDGGQWGILVKTDQRDKMPSGYIPADILVWRPTREHFDVIGGSGHPTWLAYGVLPKPAWVWREIPPSVVTPDPDPEPEPEPDPGEPSLIALLEELRAQIAVLTAKVDALASLPSKPFPNYVGTLRIPIIGSTPVVLTPQEK
jgi:hypothetical protein